MYAPTSIYQNIEAAENKPSENKDNKNLFFLSKEVEKIIKNNRNKNNLSGNALRS